MPIHNILECVDELSVVLNDSLIFGIYGIKADKAIYDVLGHKALVIRGTVLYLRDELFVGCISM
ncbi:MAG: hypothetical protein ACI3XI_04290 [Eubacteriales bacterium]